MKQPEKPEPMPSVTVRMSNDMITELKTMAKRRKMSSYQGLVREYIEAGLLKDNERLRWSAISRILDELRERGVPDSIINESVQAAVADLPSPL